MPPLDTVQIVVPRKSSTLSARSATCRTASLKCPPIPARSTFGDQGSARPGRARPRRRRRPLRCAGSPRRSPGPGYPRGRTPVRCSFLPPRLSARRRFPAGSRASATRPKTGSPRTTGSRAPMSCRISLRFNPDSLTISARIFNPPEALRRQGEALRSERAVRSFGTRIRRQPCPALHPRVVARTDDRQSAQVRKPAKMSARSGCRSCESAARRCARRGEAAAAQHLVVAEPGLGVFLVRVAHEPGVRAGTRSRSIPTPDLNFRGPFSAANSIPLRSTGAGRRSSSRPALRASSRASPAHTGARSTQRSNRRCFRPPVARQRRAAGIHELLVLVRHRCRATCGSSRTSGWLHFSLSKTKPSPGFEPRRKDAPGIVPVPGGHHAV